VDDEVIGKEADNGRGGNGYEYVIEFNVRGIDIDVLGSDLYLVSYGETGRKL
jgi:hypothetical protein